MQQSIARICWSCCFYSHYPSIDWPSFPMSLVLLYLARAPFGDTRERVAIVQCVCSSLVRRSYEKATRATRIWLETCVKEEEGSPASLIRLRACRSVQDWLTQHILWYMLSVPIVLTRQKCSLLWCPCGCRSVFIIVTIIESR
jgi:hypothetical protein